MTREARTEPIPHPQPEPAEDATPATPDALPPHSVRLKDGRIATLRENSAFEARQKRKALGRMGISADIDRADFLIGMAIMSIATLGGEPFKAPTTEMTYNALLMDGMSEADTYRLSAVYGELIGEGDPGDADFRQAV